MQQSSYKSILVPLDGSEFSARALPVAAAFARRTGAALHLAVVYDPSTFLHFAPGSTTMPAFDRGTIDKFCESAKNWVEEQAASIANTGLTASGTLLEGTVVEAIAEHAVAVAADIVVMTTHGRSGADRLWLGSVAGAFLARSPAPVFLVRPSGADAPVAGHELPSGTLMVPLDGSSFSESMLPQAQQFAAALSLKLELVMVVAPSVMPMALFGADALAMEDFNTLDEESTARNYLSRIAKDLVPPAAITVLSEFLVARALIDHAAHTHPGAIAMATHGNSGLVRLVVGSVADKLLRGAEQPLLVFRPPDGGNHRGSAG